MAHQPLTLAFVAGQIARADSGVTLARPLAPDFGMGVRFGNSNADLMGGEWNPYENSDRCDDQKKNYAADEDCHTAGDSYRHPAPKGRHEANLSAGRA